jgi:hypothetical protein
MKHAGSIIVIMLVSSLFTGCGSDFSVSNAGTLATAEVTGITFEVASPGSGGAGGVTLNTGNKKNCTMTLGDVTIELGAATDGKRELTINANKYGTVTKGDKVVVTESRSVTINGSERAAEQ